MTRIVFRDASVIDGTGAPPSRADVEVRGNRIASLVSPSSVVARDDVQVVECRGATLMPGLIESHAHLSFVDSTTLLMHSMLPVEEHLLATLKYAKLYLDSGFTSCFSAAASQAAPRCRDAERDRQRRSPRSAVARCERAAHADRRGRRSSTTPSGSGRRDVHAAVRRADRVPPRRARSLSRRRGRAEDRPVRRHIDTAHSVGQHADDRRRGGRGLRGRAGARKARGRPRPQRGIDQVVRPARRRRRLSRDLRGRAGARHAGGGQ